MGVTIDKTTDRKLPEQEKPEQPKRPDNVSRRESQLGGAQAKPEGGDAPEPQGQDKI